MGTLLYREMNISLIFTYRGANPDFTSSELLYQLQMTKASVMIVHPDALTRALDAARQAGLADDRIVLFDTNGITTDMYQKHETVGSLLEFGLRNKASYIERTLAPGEGKTKLALLSFSSGTTGRPKVRQLSSFPWSSKLSLDIMDLLGCCDSSFCLDCECDTNCRP